MFTLGGRVGRNNLIYEIDDNFFFNTLEQNLFCLLYYEEEDEEVDRENSSKRKDMSCTHVVVVCLRLKIRRIKICFVSFILSI